MQFGNHPYYANDLMLRREEKSNCCLRILQHPNSFVCFTVRRSSYPGRAAILLVDYGEDSETRTQEIPEISQRIDAVKVARLEKASDLQATKLALPHTDFAINITQHQLLVVPIVSSENRQYLPVGITNSDAVVHNKAFALYDAPLWNMALIASRLHRVWIGTVCAQTPTDLSYSNTLGWNTFPVPTLTDQNKADLTRCAEDILLAREAHFPATIADLYDPDDDAGQPARSRTSATTRRWSGSTSAAASRTTPSGWKSSSNSTRR